LKIIKDIFIKPSILVFLFIGMAIMIISSAYFELNRSEEEVLHLMSEEAHSLLNSVIVSSQEVLYASNEVEDEIQNRLLNNANIVRILYDKKKISNSILREITNHNEVNRIHIFNKTGKRIYTSHFDINNKMPPKDYIQNMFNPIFENEIDTMIVGFRESRVEDGVRYVVAIASEDNNAIVLNLDAAELLAFKKRIGFGVLIKRLTENEDVLFALLENNDGILAASGYINGLDNIGESKFLQSVMSDSTYAWRVVENDSIKIFEAVHPFELDGNLVGLYRIGLSLNPLESITARLQRRIIISGIILFVVGFIMITLVFVRENLDVVKKQYLKIESYSKKLIESVSDAIVVVNNENKIIEINKSAENLFQLVGKSIIGSSLNSILDENCQESFNRENNIQQVECRINNYIKELLISSSKFIDENENENFVFIIKDLTELKKLEKQLARNEQMNAMGQLASSVAHEIRNPLNSIATIVQQLDKDFEPVNEQEEYHSLAGIVAKEVKRMNGTIENFLRFSRPEAIIKKDFKLSELINSVEIQFQSHLRKNGISLTITEEWDGIVNWDRNQIKQVLINLIKNSIEAIEKSGEIKINIEQKDDKVDISVADTGEGIPEENLQRIFNLYFTSKAKGTGIGLSIIQRIINEHDGVVNVESKVGEGTKFTLTIPINYLGK
jgi:PAS domain S-box-containing protein